MTATEAPPAGTASPTDNPFVGPRSLTKEDGALHGRARESRELYNLLLSNRVVLFYSPSGAGKTSLIQAGLLPSLDSLEDGLPALPVARVGRPSESGDRNRYTASVLASLGAPAEVVDAGTTLHDYLDSVVPTDGRGLLVFDQFEEVLSLDPTDGPAKRAFLAELGTALRDRRWFALFAMREDFLAALDPYLDLVPTRLATRFRLDLLSQQAAAQVVVETARSGHRTVAPEACAALCTELSRLVDGRVGPFVEPVQLQVVCRRLWAHLPPGNTEITTADVKALGDVSGALGSYYGEKVAEVAKATGTPERVIRDWFERELVTDRGYRGQTQAGPTADTAVLRQLEDAHLVRSETRRGTRWHELAHDRLVEPVRSDNRAWREQHLTAFQRQAGLWDEHGRRDELLVVDEILDEGEALATEAGAELTPVESAFLDASRKARVAGQKEQAANRRTKRYLRISAALLVVAVGLSFGVVVGLVNANRATNRAEEGERLRLAGPALDNADSDPNLSANLALHALEGLDAVDTPGGIAAQRALYHRLFRTNRVRLTIPGSGIQRAVYSADGSRIGIAGASGSSAYDVADLSAEDFDDAPARDIAFSKNGDAATVGHDGDVVVWPHSDSAEPSFLEVDRTVPVEALAFDPRGALLAVASGDVVRVWEWNRPRPSSDVEEEFTGEGETQVGSTTYGRVDQADDAVVLRGHDGPVRAIAFSPDGSLLATASTDATITLWSPVVGKTEWEAKTTLRGHRGPVSGVAFNPSGAVLASAGDDGTVRTWDVASGQQRQELVGHDAAVTDVTFSPDGNRLATGGADGTARVWDWSIPRVVAEAAGSTGAITSLAFHPDARTLLVATANGAPAEWDISIEAPPGHVEDVAAVDFSPEGDRVATASFDGTAAIWDLGGKQLVQIAAHREGVSSVVFGPGGRVATASFDGTARLWDATTGRALQVFAAGPDAIVDVALAGDGTRLATVGDDGSARIWDTATGAELRRLAGDGLPRGIAFSPEGQRVAVAIDVGVTVWDIATGTRIRDFTVTGDDTLAGDVAFSPDGRLVAESTLTGTFVWDAGSGRLLWRQGELLLDVPGQVAFSGDGTLIASSDGHVRRVTDGSDVMAADPSFGADLSPDGRLLALAGGEVAPGLFDVASGTRVTGLGAPPAGQARFVDIVVADPTGRRLATAGDGMVAIWDVASERRERLLDAEGTVGDLAFSPDGRQLIAATAEGQARIWEASTGKVNAVLDHGDGEVQHVAFAPDNETVTTVRLSTSDGALEFLVWDVTERTPKRVSRRPVPPESEVRGLSEDGRRAVVVVREDAVEVIDVRTGRTRATFEMDLYPEMVAIDPSGERVVIADEDGGLHLGDTDGETLLPLFTPRPRPRTDYVTSLVFSPDGRFAAAASTARVTVWDVRNDQRILYDIPPVVADDVLVAFGPERTYLAVAQMSNGTPITVPLDLSALRRATQATVARPLVGEECERYLQRAC